MKIYTLLILSCTLLISACSTSRIDVNTYEEYIEQSNHETNFDQLYKVQIGDSIGIKFKYNPELDESTVVLPDGTISTRFVTGLHVKDKNIKFIHGEVLKYYSKYLNEPEMNIVMESYSPERIFVSGEVSRPGEYINVGNPMTVMQVLAKAGGLRDSASYNQILIVRNINGEKKVFSVNYKEMAQKGIFNNDIYLESEDIVFVPKNGAAQNYRIYDQYFRKFIDLRASGSINATAVKDL